MSALFVPTLSYPGWLEDKKEVERLYCEWPSPSFAQEKLIGMKNKQRLFEGDRTHPEIITLDNTIFTYDGCEEDRKEAEQIHTASASIWDEFDRKLDEMKRKQVVHSNRSSVGLLRDLDNGVFSYPDWDADKREVESLYREMPGRAKNKLDGMRNKQRLFEGDRSHPEIITLDNTIFTYNGWEEDRKEAEQIHTASTSIWADFDGQLDEMKKKQSVHSNRSSVSLLQDLDNSVFSYPDWRADKRKVESLYCEMPRPVHAKNKLDGMRNKQRLFEGDRSHPDIVTLDNARFTYLGWEEDKQEAEQIHTASASIWAEDFDRKLDDMKKKQIFHSNRSSITIMRDLDSLSPPQPATPEPEDTSIEVSQSSRTVSPEPVRPTRSERQKPVSSDPVQPKEHQGSVSPEPMRPQDHCVICLEEEPSHAYIPCGHRCVCTSCASGACSSQYGELKCPLCRDSAMCVTKIFL